MKQFISYIVVFLLLVALVSCEERIEYIGPEQDPVLVLFCEAGVGDTVVDCYVSRSAFFLEHIDSLSQLLVSDVSVSFSRDGGEWLEVPVSSEPVNRRTATRHYSLRLEEPLRVGECLALRAESEGMKTVESQVRVMPKPSIRFVSCDTDSLGAVVRLVVDKYEADSAYLGVTLQMTEKSKGAVYAKRDKDGYWLNCLFGSNSLVFASLPNAYSIQEGYVTTSELFFLPSDRLACDTMEFRLYKADGLYYGQRLMFAKVRVRVLAHSWDSYQYLCSVRAYNGEDMTDELDLGAVIYNLIGMGQQEQVPVYSNVRNGLGIFNATSFSDREFLFD